MVVLREVGAAVAGARGAGCVSVAWGTGRTVEARVAALGGAGTAGAGALGVVAAPRGAGAVRVRG